LTWCVEVRGAVFQLAVFVATCSGVLWHLLKEE